MPAVRRTGYFLRSLNALVLLVALPLIVVQVFQFMREKSLAEQTAFSGLNARAETLAGDMSKALGRAEGLLDFLASREGIRALNPASCRSLLADAYTVDALYSNVVLVSMAGQLVCASNQKQSSAQLAETPWFVEATHATAYHLSDPFVGRVSGRQLSMLTVPVFDGNGAQVALLGLAIDLRAAGVSLGPDGALPSERVAIVKRERLYFTRSVDPQRWIGREVAFVLPGGVAGAVAGVVKGTGTEGDDRLFRAYKVPRYDLHVLVSQPTSVVYADMGAAAGSYVAAVVLVLSWGLLAAYFGARRLAAPVQKVARAVHAISEGDTQVRVDPSLPGELGDVANEFNRLMDLQERATLDLKESEARALLASNFYAALSRTNKLIGQVTRPEALFQGVCAICVEAGLADMAWIGEVEGRRVRPVAWAGGARDYTDGADVRLDDPALQGPISRAVALGVACTANDHGLDPALAPLQARGQKFGIEASAAFPFTVKGQVVGTLNLYVSRKNYFDPGLMALFESMARDISLGLEGLRRAEEQESLRMTEAANRARARFFTQVSHELRTPLNAILGFTQLLHLESRDLLSPRGRQQLDNVYLGGTQLRALIDDVLDLSRIDAGMMTLEYRDVPLRELLDGVLKLLEPMASASQIALRLDCALPVARRLSTDPVRLRQIVLNLMSNAIKYNRRGGSVRLLVQRLDDRLELVVEDTGLGMSPAQLERLFQPFNRLGRERSSIEGTGIGLSLTRQLVELFDGTMRIESREQAGTCVTVHLPWRDAPSSPAAVPSLDRADIAREAAGPAGVVLYIEDNPVNAILVEQLLDTWKEVKLFVVGSGGEGLRQARQLMPDLVLLDMNLPDMDGIRVLKDLRADPATRSLRVVVLSASAMPEDVQAARQAGADDYWTKPIDFVRVLRGLEKALTRVAA